MFLTLAGPSAQPTVAEGVSEPRFGTTTRNSCCSRRCTEHMVFRWNVSHQILGISIQLKLCGHGCDRTLPARSKTILQPTVPSPQGSSVSEWLTSCMGMRQYVQGRSGACFPSLCGACQSACRSPRRNSMDGVASSAHVLTSGYCTDGLLCQRPSLIHSIASRQSSSGCALCVCRTTSDCQFDLHVARFRMLSHRQSSDLLQMKNMMCMQHAMKEKNIASMFVCLCLLPMLLMDCIVLFMCDTAPPAQNSVLLGIDFGSVRCYTMVCRDACAHCVAQALLV